MVSIVPKLFDDFKSKLLIGLSLALNFDAFGQFQIVSSGSGNNFSITYPANLSGSVPVGLMLTFKSNQTITASANLILNTFGPFIIKKNVTQNLSSGDIVTSQFVTVIFDGTNFQLISKTAVDQINGQGSSPGVAFFGGLNSLTTSSFFQWDNTNLLLSLSSTGVNANALQLSGNINLTSALSEYRIGNSRLMGINNRIENLFVGVQAGFSTPSSTSYNTFVGYQSGYSNSSGYENTMLGAESGKGNTTGQFNTFIGRQAGIGNVNGYNNTFVGFQAGGTNVSGVYNTLIGSGSSVTSGINYATAIGEGALVSQSSSMVLGRIGVNVGIGTSSPAPSSVLELNSTVAGFLPPRMTTVQRDAISSPADGLVIYNLDTKCLNYYSAGYFWVQTCGDPIAGATIPVGNISYTYTGASQIFTVPPFVNKINVSVYGAGGGNGYNSGGYGGYVSGNMVVRPGDVFTLIVGGAGVSTANRAGAGGGGFSMISKGSTMIALAAGGGGAAGYEATYYGAAGGNGGVGGSSGSSGGCGTGGSLGGYAGGAGYTYGASGSSLGGGTGGTGGSTSGYPTDIAGGGGGGGWGEAAGVGGASAGGYPGKNGGYGGGGGGGGGGLGSSINRYSGGGGGGGGYGGGSGGNVTTAISCSTGGSGGGGGGNSYYNSTILLGAYSSWGYTSPALNGSIYISW